MYDERAIARFAATFEVPYSEMYLEHRQHLFYKVIVRGRSAERILALLWPYVVGTDKGDQILRYATKLGVEDWITGKETRPRPQEKRGRRCGSMSTPRS